MKTQPSLTCAIRSTVRQIHRPNVCVNRRRNLYISSTPTVESPDLSGDPLNHSLGNSADARFEVLGAPYSLLSVSLSASQKLYTRRGTLVGVSGKAENAQSTLSILEPLRRALVGIPFLYQRITSTTPLTALISTKSPITSLSVIHLDGTVDWMISQRKALLAWTGHHLTVSPTINRSMSLAHWGNTEVSGRGLVAVAGPGQIYQLRLQAGEKYVAHPGNVIAYTITATPPRPYRFKTSSLRFQIPDINVSSILPDTKFFRVMRSSGTWKAMAKIMFNVRTMARRTIWGDRLFLQFQGPTTILLSSRASRISDVLTNRDVDEIADTEAGIVRSAVTSATTPKEEAPEVKHDVPTGFMMASVGKGGEVKFEDVKSIEALKR